MNLDIEQLTEDQKRIGFILLIGLSALWIIWSISHTVMTYRDYQFEKPTTMASPPNGHANRLVNNTVAAKLFGEIRVTNQATPFTSLNWKLRGVVVAGPRKNSHAIIENSNGVEGQYRIGDTIESGITLHNIKHDRVILKRQGKLESLLLDPEPLKQAPPDQQLFDFNQFKESQ